MARSAVRWRTGAQQRETWLVPRLLSIRKTEESGLLGAGRPGLRLELIELFLLLLQLRLQPLQNFLPSRAAGVDGLILQAGPHFLDLSLDGLLVLGQIRDAVGIGVRSLVALFALVGGGVLVGGG